MSQVQEVKQASDIIQIIGERITLQRSGSQYRGLCPFHSEHSPSFFVSEQFQRYKCFGCGEGGDVFTFLEKYEGMTFGEAIQYLADRANITLEKFQMDPQDEERQQVLAVLDLAKEYYHYLLTEHKAGEAGRLYLKERGTNAESVKLFQLGYALNSWDGLYKYLHDKKKFPDAILLAAGLIIQSPKGKLYDRFRDRVMFPLTDHRGRVVGFSGRTLQKDTKEAKYINSPETLVYHKSQMLFGYSQLYQQLRKANEAIVVEGEFDVLSSAQAFVHNVVGVKGSALTEEHCRLLSRTVARVILAFDMDKAGVAATRRAIQVAKPFNLELRVIQLPAEFAAKDPDELARNNPDVWRDASKQSISIYEFCLQAAKKQFGVDTPEGKRHIVDQVAPILSEISHAVELDFYTNKLAEMLNVSSEVIKTDLQRAQKAKKLKLIGRKAPEEKDEIQSNASAENTVRQPTKPRTRKDNLANYALFLLFNSPMTQMKTKAEQLKHVHFVDAVSGELVQKLLNAPTLTDLQIWARDLSEDEQQQVFQLSAQTEYMQLLNTADLEKEWNKAISELIQLDIADEIDEITKELDTLDALHHLAAEDDAKQAELLQKIVKLRGKQRRV